MSAISLSEAETELAAALEALREARKAQSYSISTGGGSRSRTQHALKDLRDEVVFWQKQVERLSRGGIKVRGATPLG